MESFQYTKFTLDEISYNLEDGEGSHQSDESHTETKSTPDCSENIELPLPPGTSGDEFFVSLGYKPEALMTSNIVKSTHEESKYKSDSFEPSNLTFGPQLPSDYQNVLENQKAYTNDGDSAVNKGNKISECLGENQYSPSKVESDEENQDVALKPKVLGKEQAKKRLMAFSIAKQSANVAKKQSKTTVAKSKEKPPNPNKGTNFQEQFRATISAIEEEKKKMYQNMPDYLLQEMNELVKGHIVSSPSMKSSDKKNQDSKRKDRSARRDSTSNKSNDRRRSSRRSRSRSSSRRRRRSRRSRSRSRSSGTHNKRRKRSWSRSRRSRSPGKKSREEKSIKTEEANPGKNEKDFIPKKDVFEDWKAFKDSGAAMDSDSVFLKNDFRESEGRELELDHMSQGFRSHYKPIFNYLKKGYNKMMPLRAKPAESNSGKRALFPEKTMKFTRTKPILIWTENPSLATDYYMPKEVLLENCPSGSEPILRFIIEGKICEPNTDFPEITPVKSRPWYSLEKYLRDTSSYSVENESLPQSSLEDESKNVDVQTSKRKISLVNEDYLSDEIEQEEVKVAGVKVRLDLEMNSVKYRSKWDSDFEEGNNERESTVNKIRNKEISRGEKSQKSKGKVTEEKNKMDDFDVEALHRSPEEKSQPLTDSSNGRGINSHPGYLASEYEEFLKMVSFDSKDPQDNQTEKVTDTVKREKIIKIENPVSENDNNLKFSIDWDKESEQEEELKVSPQKIEAGEKLLKAEKVKKKKNRIEKVKPKKKKIMKKPIKGKKDRCKDSYREDSSSSESESESDSDSDESNSPEREKRKKSESKRKKIPKEKKKSKKNFSDKSESDSDGGKPKKKTKKKGGSSDSDESQNKLLKQIVLKKQLIMKKVEEIDTVMGKIDEKKGKENESKKECGEKERGLKPSKKKSKSVKKNKVKKFKKTDTESDSRSSGESTKRKKGKKEIKEKRFSSESSDSEDDAKSSKKKTNKYKKTKKEKKKRGRKFSDSSESEDSLVSKKWKKKKKEDLNSVKDLKSNIAVTETEVRTEERLTQRDRRMLKKKEKKAKKEDDDWETSSSSVESEEECESSWDEEAKTTIKVAESHVVKEAESHVVKEKRVDAVVPEKEGSEKDLSSDRNFNSGMETLKNSLSNFLFNENSFCCFGQELSRDFFLTERSLSSSANIGVCENAAMTPINARPFQYIGKGGEKKTVDSELYSPGCSESEMSDAEDKSQKSKTDSPTIDVYDPLNCESEASADNNEVELSTIPLPTSGGISLPGEGKLQKVVMSPPVPKVNNELEKTLPSATPPRKFTGNEFNLISNASLKEHSPKMQIMNFKGQQTLKTKAASVFQDDSDEENKEREKSKEEEKQKKTDKETQEKKRSKKERRDGSKERNRGRSRSREKKVKKSPQKAPEASKREIRSDSFEIEPLKSVTDEVVDSVQPIPVLLGVSSNRVWSGSLPGYEFSQVSDSLVDQAESFDIYPSEESKYHTEDYNRDLSVEKPIEKSNKRRKSQSRSVSPKKKRKSKSPIRRRSPKRWSASPKLRDKSPRSPRRRSPKRKSPSRRRSRSPSRRRKSRRLSSPRRSRSKSPPKRRSPKRWDSPHRRKDSPTRGYSPRRDSRYSNYPELPYWVGTLENNEDMEVNRPCARSPQYDSSMAFPGMPAPSVNEAEMNNSFYESEYNNEYGVSSYREEIGINNLITIKNHSVEKMESPKRPSLDQRIELELGSPISSSSSQYPSTSQPLQTFEGADPNHYQTYNCDNSSAGENFYQNQAMPDFNGQYFNEVQPSNYASYSYSQPPSVQNAVMQVGNIVEVVPAAVQHPLQPSLPPPKTPQIMQVGNVLQVVPTQKVPTPTPVPPPVLDYDSLPSSPVVKTQKATAVVAPSSVVPPPNLEAMINPLIKAILLEREKRRKAKEKRRLEREARRKARQLRREAKLMSVSEKLKKSVQNEGLVLGQEVEDDELLDAMDIPSPPVPVQIITVSSPSAASPAGKGILITAGFVSKSPSKKKEVKFADGVYPGEGTSSSGEEDIPLSPPKPKLPKEKPFRKKKIKVKKKVKVHIIKQILHEEEDDECDDNLSPPPPPPGDPPPVFFARFPFAGNTQFPVYQIQTTTATAQYPAQAV